MEEALRQSEERMRQLQKMEAVGRLAGGIAHDFNNLLTTIIGYSDLMMSDLEFERTKWFEDVQEIKAAAERAGGLTQQILAFSRRQRLQTEVVSVNSLVTEIAPLLRRTLGENVELVTRLDPDVSMVDIDPQQFTQALMNLAVNALDAMPSGGQLTFTTGDVWLDEGSAVKDPDIAPGSYVRVTVSDTGVGIDPSVVPLIYEPFYTTKPPGQGTGLGLPTVYGVVKQSGGAITVDSTPGKGTTFEIFLPQVKGTQGPQSGGGAAAEGDPPEAPAQQRVLVVEDEEAVRRLTERILKQLGYAVESAANGPEALAILQAAGDSPIDLLLTDVVLPGGLDGGEIARRARAVRDDLAVLYVSGYSRNAVLDSGDAEQDVYYLEKPFTAEQLAAKVRDALAATKGLQGSQRTK
jgi:two-component system cell cycle sensor histidine kinase/response regulator CckA